MRKAIVIATTLLFCQAFFAQPALERNEQDTTVYMCTGASSKCYHKTDKCKGISRCSKEIIEVKKSYADSIGRKACKMCYKD